MAVSPATATPIVRRASATPSLVVASLVVACLALVAALGPGGASAAAAAPERCDGVWVVVDASVLGGPVTTRCATTDRAIDGAEVLTRAGHHVSDVPGQPGFVCRIDRRPDPCPGTPPADAYWSYWLAEPGGEWRFSQHGATFREAEPGTVDAWAFGAGEPPSIPPPAPSVPDRSPPPAEDDTSDDERAGDGSGDGASSSSPDPSEDAGDAATDRDGADDGDSGAPDAATGTGAGDRGNVDGDSGDGGAAPTASSSRPHDAMTGRDLPLADTTPDTEPDTDGDGEDAGAAASPGDADEPVDAVSVGRGTVGGSAIPVAVGGSLLAGLAGTAAWTARRRGLGDDSAP